MKNYRICKLEWATGSEYIESLRLTMSNGDVSPRFGAKSFTDFCQVDETISKIKVGTKNNRLVSLEFYTGKDTHFLSIAANEDA
jgi:hypothetical protein